MINKLLYAPALAAALASSAVQAQSIDEATEDFVTSNMIAVLYHELGHALIDLLQLPVFGQEEDAADVLSVVLIQEQFEEEYAASIAYATAFGYARSAEETEAAGYDVAYWGVHGADLQRYYNLVCLFYGANPDEREDFAEELGLPEERAFSCPEEYQLASDSWGAVLDELYDAAPGVVRYEDMGDDAPFAVLTHNIVFTELQALSEAMALPEALKVSVAYCGEANAFYDPNTQEVIMCIEYAEYIASLIE